jgi:sulfoacetaldehyde dehydrogenase
MGNIESKFSKLAQKIPGCFYDVKDQKTVGVIEKNIETGITKIAKPIGIIGALIPSTNPEATPVFKGMLALRGKNSVVFGPHPASWKTTHRVVEIMRQVLKDNGAPEDLFICVDKPSKEISQEIMKQCDLIMATGSKDMVHAAYSSGKPSYGVGVGNAVIVVDDTVDLSDTSEKIRIGKIGDNASGCSAENSLIIQENIYEEMKTELQRVGGYLCNTSEKQKLQKAMWNNGRLRREIVAKNIETIAAEAQIIIPKETQFLMVEETNVGPDAPFSGEKLSLVLTLYKYNNFKDAVDRVNEITGYSGLGHSCGIHSHNQERILQLALKTKTSRVTVRQPHGAANSGNWFNGLAFTFSLGCGTWGGNSASENITQKHYINITQLAEPIDREAPSEVEIYGDLLEGMNIYNE